MLIFKGCYLLINLRPFILKPHLFFLEHLVKSSYLKFFGYNPSFMGMFIFFLQRRIKTMCIVAQLMCYRQVNYVFRDHIKFKQGVYCYLCILSCFFYMPELILGFALELYNNIV